MIKNILFAALFLFGLLLCQMPGVCFADAAAQLEQAEKCEETGKYEEAEAMYKQIVTEYPGTDPYPNCVAGWDSGIKIGTNPEGQCGDVEIGVWDVPPIVVIHQIKTWEPDPDISHTKPDILRMWQVNVTEIEFWVRVGVVSRIEELCGITQCPGSWVGQNTQQISSVEVKELDGTFEIVP